MMQHNSDWAYGLLMKACSICSITTQVSGATLSDKSHISNCVCLLFGADQVQRKQPYGSSESESKH